MTSLMLLLLFEGATFIAASLVHRGALVTGYEHGRAAIAETVIGVVLLAGAVLVRLVPARARSVGVAAQAFAVLGTLVGLVMVAIGVAPRTVPDVVYHFTILAVLVAGLARTARPADARAIGGGPFRVGR